MPIFYYKARDKAGRLIKGEVEAISAEELKEGLFREDTIPLLVREIRFSSISFETINRFFRHVRHEDLMIFTRQFYTLFKAGVSMDTIFSSMIKQVSSTALKNALTRIKADIASGSSLSQAFARHSRIFDELYVSMLAAGEEAGILEDVLRQLSTLLEKDYEIKKGVKNAMLYPKIVLTVLVLATTFLMTFVVPKFAVFYGHYGAKLPLPTMILIGMSNFVRGYWYIVLGIFLLISYLFVRYYRTKTGRFKIDAYRLEMPVFGQLELKVANARFARILAALYRSGLHMPRCLEVVAGVIGNEAFAREVRMLRDDIQKGATLSEAMGRRHYFSGVMTETTAVGERAGALDELLSTVADHYELEVSYTVRNLTTLLEPLMLVGIFGMVLLLALAIFLPIWNLSTVVGKH